MCFYVHLEHLYIHYIFVLKLDFHVIFLFCFFSSIEYIASALFSPYIYCSSNFGIFNRLSPSHNATSWTGHYFYKLIICFFQILFLPLLFGHFPVHAQQLLFISLSPNFRLAFFLCLVLLLFL